jgi:hypothetical protein
LLAKVSRSFSGILAKVSGSQRKCLQKLAEVSGLAISVLAKVEIIGLAVSELTKKVKQICELEISGILLIWIHYCGSRLPLVI